LRTTPGYCWYCNDTNIAKVPYGALYNWFAVNTGKLAPIGWHVPTDAEWSELTTYLGGESIAGGKLKDTGLSRWLSPNTGATNQTGFSARPGGGRSGGGGFYGMGRRSHWWTASGDYSDFSHRRSIYSDKSFVESILDDNNCGYYVRLVKDSKDYKQAIIKKQTKRKQKSVNDTMSRFVDSVESKIGTLYDKIKFLREQNVNDTDTLLVNKAIQETEVYCQNVFKEAGCSQNALFTLKSTIPSINVWLIFLRNVINQKPSGFSFNEYCNGIRILLANSTADFNNGRLCSVRIHSYSYPNVKITSMTPKLSLSQVIKNYRRLRHIPGTVSVTPFFYGPNKVIHGCINNVPIDSLPQKGLMYIQEDRTDTVIALYWKLWVENYKNENRFVIGGGTKRVYINAVTGKILYEGFGGCFCQY